MQKRLTKLQRARNRIKREKEKFNQELKKALNTAIVAAFGFLIALVWKDVITEYVETITSLSPVNGKIIQAVFVTIIAVIGIIIVSRIFSEKDK